MESQGFCVYSGNKPFDRDTVSEAPFIALVVFVFTKPGLLPFFSGTCACGVSSDKPVQNPRSDDLALCFTQVSVVLTLGFSELGSPRSFFCIWMSCRHRTTCHTVSASLSGFLGLSGTQLPRSPGAVSQWVCASTLLPLYLKTPMRMDQGPPQ